MLKATGGIQRLAGVATYVAPPSAEFGAGRSVMQQR